MRKIEKIVLVEMKSRIPNLNSMLLTFKHGALTVGSKLKEAGYDVTYLYEPITGKITSEYIKTYDPDLVAFTGITSNIDRVEDVARELSGQGFKILLGGEHASMMPDLVDFADFIILNEGEQAAVQLFNSLNNGDELSQVDNLRFRLNGRYIQNPVRDPKDLSIDYRLDPSIIEGLGSLDPLRKRMLRFPLQTSRGCPYSCRFCPTKDLFGKKYRRRPIEDVISDIESVLESGTRTFLIVDNDFGIGQRETTLLLERIIAGCYDSKFSALVRTDIAKNRKILELMRKAGVTNLSVGIESVSDSTLAELDKRQNIAETTTALEVLHGYGFSLLGLFMAGADHDTVDTIRMIPEFALNHHIDKIQIVPLTFFPTPNKQQMFPFYRFIKGIPLDYYNGHFVTIFPTQMRPSVLQEEIEQAYTQFYSFRGILSALNSSGRRIPAFLGRAAVGCAQKYVSRAIERTGYLPMLKGIEHPYYEGNRLDEGKLERAFRKPKTI